MGWLLFLAAFYLAFTRLRLFRDAVCALAFTLGGILIWPFVAVWALLAMARRAIGL